MSDTAPPPAGWYPDPKPADPVAPGERWWNGSEWTVSTRTEDTPVFSYGEPPAPKRTRRPGPVLIGAVAAVVGMGVGSLITYFAMDGNSGSSTTASSRPFAGGGQNGGGQNGGDGLNPFGGGSGGSGGGGGQNGGGNGGIPGLGGGSGSGSGTAVDVVDGVSIPLPSGWTGGTTTDGHASGSFGSYTCAGSSGSSGSSGGSGGSGNTCSYAGADTVTLKNSVSSGAQAAAQQDITAAVKESYGDVTGHQVLEQKAVTVAGRSGYLVRWQVDAKVGNNGTVETVVFPDKAGKNLIALHLGFDVASKAPSLSVMDQIVSGVADFSGGSLGGGQAPGTS